MTKKHLEEAEHLFQAVLKLQTVEECQAFFDDLCTIKEIQDLSQRFQVAQMLSRRTSYAAISKNTGASTATISRVSRAYKYGAGGYKLVIGRMEEEA